MKTVGRTDVWFSVYLVWFWTKNLNQNEAQSPQSTHKGVNKSTHKGVNKRSKDVTQTQQQRPESPTACVAECARNGGYLQATGGIQFWGYISSEFYVPCLNYSHAGWVTIGDSGLCWHVCVASFKCWLAPLCDCLMKNDILWKRHKTHVWFLTILFLLYKLLREHSGKNKTKLSGYSHLAYA